MLLVYMTTYIAISPLNAPIPSPSVTSGIFSTTNFLGPLIGGITNAILLTLFIYCFGGVSGAHLNPLISLATFFARLTSLPRTVLYVVFQTIGATLAGLLIRASYGTREFKTGGCFLETETVTIGSMFAIEFTACLTLLFLAFGVGLDPSQRQIFGPALAPILVGLALGVMSFGTAFARPGYGGASMNPARCFGVFVGSRFPGWHWIHWVAPLAAGMLHGLFYIIIPPWTETAEASK